MRILSLSPCIVQHTDTTEAALLAAVVKARKQEPEGSPNHSGCFKLWGRCSYYTLSEATVSILSENIAQIRGVIPLYEEWYGSEMWDTPNPPEVLGGWPKITRTRSKWDPQYWLKGPTYEIWDRCLYRVGEIEITFIVPTSQIRGVPA